jgi:putative restriction endonuclease
MDLATERAMRNAAMQWLREREANGPTAFLRSDRFSYLGQTIRFMNPQTGIWKPNGWVGALSISTVFSPKASARPYEDDVVGSDGLGRYKWRGLDRNHPDNRALRAAMENDLALIWFIGSAPGLYAAVYPVFLVKEEPERQQFVVAAPDVTVWDDRAPVLDAAYALRETKQRLHQKPFRIAVLGAYKCRCAVCRFGHFELLDAAHIVADAEGGRPDVTNGLSLCKMHHAAYDRNIIGITPEFVVEVNHDVLNETDGPMLRYGIQEFHGRPLMVLPDKRSQRPDPAALQARYDLFLSHS